MYDKLGSGLLRALTGVVAALVLTAASAMAGPWAEVGDAQLRSDIDILASAGVIDNITMQWPLPWRGILDRLKKPGALDGQPDYVRQAARRVEARGDEETGPGLRTSATFDATGSPAVVRGFDALGRQTMQGQGILEYLSGGTTVHLALGARTVSGTDHQIFVPDGSYLSQRVGGVNLYAGYVTHWWGPGWISAMSLSNNARPVPQIGIARAETTPFRSPWLSWLGPWQMEFFVGVLDGPRVARNTIYDGFRVGFSPLPHLEVGISRTDMMCGTGHPCKPLAGYFEAFNRTHQPNIVNDEATFDVRYSSVFDHWAYEVYAQAMNEDSNPLFHSATSHLFGGSMWTPYSGGGARLTIEYTDSHPTANLYGGRIRHGAAYNNFQYIDGMRYRGRTLGFSLDSDSRLVSVQWNFTTAMGRSVTLTYHHADISDPKNVIGNVVTTSPVTINVVQGRISLPLQLNNRRVRLDLEGRVQDDQPRSNRGWLATAEVALSAEL